MKTAGTAGMMPESGSQFCNMGQGTEQTPSTGIQHPSCGGRCWKGVLVMWVRSGLKWMVMSFGLAGSAGGCALSSQ